MGKFAQYMNQNMTKLKQVYIRYIGTILCAVAVSIIMIHEEATVVVYSSDIHETLLMIFSLFLVGNFFVESIFKKSGENTPKHKKCVFIGYAISLVIAVLFKVSYYLLIDNATDKWELKQLIFGSVLYFYLILMVGLALFFLIREQTIGVPAYIGRAGFALLRAAGVFFVLNVAVILILQIIDSLLFSFDLWDIEEYIQIFLAGSVYFPVCLLAVSDTTEDNAAFTKKFVSYVLMPCVWIAMAIIYVYVIKIFVTQTIPDNEIFGICSWLFVIGAPIWMMAYGFLEKRNTKYWKLVKNTKYIYAPFILLEIFSVGIRIHEYGLTESRYAAIMFIVVQLIYIFWEQLCTLFAKLRKKPREEYGEKYEGMLIVLVVFSFIGLLLPFGNAAYMSYISQKNRLLTYQESNKPAAGEAYRYLKYYNPYGERYLDKTFTKEQIAKFESDEYYENTNKKDWEYVYFRVEPLKEGLTIGPEYNTLYSFYGAWYEIKSLDDLADIDITVGDRVIEGVDLRDCIQYYVEIGDSQDDIDDIYEMQLDNRTKIMIRKIDFDYTYGLKEIRDLRIEGYLLEK